MCFYVTMINYVAKNKKELGHMVPHRFNFKIK